MNVCSRPTDARLADGPKSGARRFVYGFFALILFGVVSYSASLALLDRIGMLPPPPLTATLCIDEKFKFLAERGDLKHIDLLAVGSSVTWRNLEMSAFEKAGLASRPLNAAPCYLHVSEMVSYTAFLLAHMPSVRTVVSVMAPRDFAECLAPRDDFFSHALATSYVFGGLPPFHIYLTNPAQAKFVRDVFQIRTMRSDPFSQFTLVMDSYGSGPLRKVSTFLPKPVVADTCFDALAELERIVAAVGAKLIVTTFPLQPEWHALYDAEGSFTQSFETRVRTSLRLPSTTFISEAQTKEPSLLHADAVHYTWDAAVVYSERLADEIVAYPLYAGSSRRNHSDHLEAAAGKN
jgi:hypothetical protein